MFESHILLRWPNSHRIYINNYELYSDRIITNHYVNSSPPNWKQYRFVSEETKQKKKKKRNLSQFITRIASRPRNNLDIWQ